uniref:Uncharacterized protein n=1 Tax=Pyramimonas obovata TaxID=1411642 RepID=A0A7S0RJJ7_9CHLO|mmetsp:Transcript_35651/g.77813  ORF Transcript_35651/g.77813 Transcript_35651/m.77813 type:complete len:169 (+) Transcript_35651:117-623(+)|eukprot:CAMPEP_0118934692 /NCGR_PEP_ID=MMETSP1169-20130426/13966_1 /TAXON_ID=36882 /ORGANISM="Pyramimonas obovata, Strain CCMP722" /LENGTH=168 /DNA_ID=CAMNT_0006877621 /DNA_START=114 /DNA_END=620 /DNA_ORIENTATION=+
MVTSKCICPSGSVLRAAVDCSTGAHPSRAFGVRRAAPARRARLVCRGAQAGNPFEGEPSRDDIVDEMHLKINSVRFSPQELMKVVRNLESGKLAWPVMSVRSDPDIEIEKAPKLPEVPKRTNEVSFSAFTAEVTARDSHDGIVDWHERQWERLRMTFSSIDEAVGDDV